VCLRSVKGTCSVCQQTTQIASRQDEAA
jgi:hypothetical protein